MLLCEDAHWDGGLRCSHRYWLVRGAGLLSALTGSWEGAGLAYWYVITYASVIRRKTGDLNLSASLRCQNIFRREGPFLADSNGACVFLRQGLVFAMQARKS